MRQLTTERVMLITLFALLFALAVRVPVDTDTWWHIRSGEYTLTEGMIYHDPFSFTKQGESWTNHSWASQIVLYAAWKLAGNAGLALYTALLATAGMAVIYRMCAGSVYLRAFVLVLGAATAAVFWSARPQMMSFFLSAVVLYILYLYKRKQTDRLWWLPAVMLVWGNLHAGFSIGFILIGGFIAGEALGNLFNSGGQDIVPWSGLRKLILVTLVAVAALVINPYGLRMLLVPLETVSIGALRDYIQEWGSPNFQGRHTWPFIFLLLGILGTVGASDKKLDWTDFVLVSGTAFMALLAGRNIAVFAVVATPVLSYHADAILRERGWVLRSVRKITLRQARLNTAIATLIVVGVLVNVVAVLNPDTVDKFQRRALPVDAVEFIASAQPPAPIFNGYNWGGYLMFALPDYLVYVDGRTDLYGDVFLNRYLRTALGSGNWRAALDEDAINTVLVEARGGLASRLREEPGWTLLYEDDQAVIFTRDEA